MMNQLELVLTDCGLEQRGRYVQPERHDEYVCEIVPSGLAPISAPSKVPFETDEEYASINVLLLGDPNAGKTTLIHSFVAWSDVNFLRLTSFLPIIQSSFTNCRLAACLDTSDSNAGLESDVSDPHSILKGRHALRLLAASRDELPFLDSDVARSVALLTSEDLIFFLSEFECFGKMARPPPLLRRLQRSRYSFLHFLELGGDHLNRLCKFAEMRRNCLCACKRSLSSDFPSLCKCCGTASCSSCLLCDRTAAGLVLEGESLAETSADLGDSALRVPLNKALVDRVACLIRRSFELVRSTRLLLYVVNCLALFGIPPSQASTQTEEYLQSRSLRKESLVDLLRRLNQAASPQLSDSLNEANEFDRTSRGVCVLLSRVPLCQCCLAKDCSSPDACRSLDRRRSFESAIAGVQEVVRCERESAGNVLPNLNEELTEKQDLRFCDRLFEAFEALAARRSIEEESSRESEDVLWRPFREAFPENAFSEARRRQRLVRSSCFAKFCIDFFHFLWATPWLPALRLQCRAALSLLGISTLQVLEGADEVKMKELPTVSNKALFARRLCVWSVVQCVASAVRLLAESEEGVDVEVLANGDSLETRGCVEKKNSFIEGLVGSFVLSRFLEFARHFRRAEEAECAYAPNRRCLALRLWVSRLHWLDYLSHTDADCCCESEDASEEETAERATQVVDETGEVVYIEPASTKKNRLADVLPFTASASAYRELTLALASAGIVLPASPSNPGHWPPVHLAVKVIKGKGDARSLLRLEARSTAVNEKRSVANDCKSDDVVRLPFHKALNALVESLLEGLSEGLISPPRQDARGKASSSCSALSPETFASVEDKVFCDLLSATRQFIQVAAALEGGGNFEALNAFKDFEALNAFKDFEALNAFKDFEASVPREEAVPLRDVLTSVCLRLLHLCGDAAQLATLSTWQGNTAACLAWSGEGANVEVRQIHPFWLVEAQIQCSAETDALEGLRGQPCAVLQSETNKIGLHFCIVNEDADNRPAADVL